MPVMPLGTSFSVEFIRMSRTPRVGFDIPPDIDIPAFLKAVSATLPHTENCPEIEHSLTLVILTDTRYEFSLLLVHSAIYSPA
jgi:hypothetical protein